MAREGLGPGGVERGVVHGQGVPPLELLAADVTGVAEDAPEVDGLHVVPDEPAAGGLELPADGADEGAGHLLAPRHELVQLLGVLVV